MTPTQKVVKKENLISFKIAQDTTSEEETFDEKAENVRPSEINTDSPGVKLQNVTKSVHLRDSNGGDIYKNRNGLKLVLDSAIRVETSASATASQRQLFHQQKETEVQKSCSVMTSPIFQQLKERRLVRKLSSADYDVAVDEGQRSPQFATMTNRPQGNHIFQSSPITTKKAIPDTPETYEKNPSGRVNATANREDVRDFS